MKIFGFNITRNAPPVAQQGWGTSNVFGPTNTWARTIRSDFENSFASINAIIDDIQSRRLFPVDAANKELPRSVSPLWWTLDHPNDRMSGQKFISTLISGYLALPETNVLLWRRQNGASLPGAPEGGFTHGTVGGFTILPRGSRRQVGGEEKFQVWTADGFNLFGRDSVMTLKHSILPDDGYTGVSPGSSSHQEAQIADYLAQQQRAFFENGAQPQLLVTFHARTAAEAELLKKDFEKHYRGTRNAGGTVYQTVISDGVAGNGEARIEVTPIAAVNNTLAINDIVAWTQGRIDGAQGVSPLMYGKADAATYNNQQTAKAAFYAKVDNVLSRFFDDFQFELERVTGAPLPFFFGYEARNAEITDEQKTVADTRVANANAYNSLINNGATPAQAAAALCLPEDWAKLSSRPLPAIAADFTPLAPMAPQNSTPQHLNITLRNIDTQNTDGGVSDQVANAQTGAGTRVSDRRPEHYAAIRRTLDDFAKAAIMSLIRAGKTNAAPADGAANALTPALRKYVNQLLAELQDFAEEGGVVAARQLAQIIKSQVVSTNYEISEDALKQITDRAERVLANFADFLDEQYRQAKADATAPTTGGDVAAWLVATSAIAARSALITDGESRHAFQRGQLDSAEQIQEATGAKIIKTWHAAGDAPCEFCAAMDGSEADVADVFAPNGDAAAIDPDDYNDGSTPDAHPNCQCEFLWSVEGEA